MTPVLSGVPVGTIVAYVGPDPDAHKKENWFPCNGGSLDKNTYVDLGNLLQETFGPYNGSLFFLPNLQGQFLRGVDPSKEHVVDPDGAKRYQQGNPETIVGPVVGSFQADAFQSHNHPGALCWGGNDGYHEGGYYCLGQMGMAGSSEETRPKNVYVYYLIYAGNPVP